MKLANHRNHLLLQPMDTTTGKPKYGKEYLSPNLKLTLHPDILQTLKKIALDSEVTLAVLAESLLISCVHSLSSFKPDEVLELIANAEQFTRELQAQDIQNQRGEH